MVEHKVTPDQICFCSLINAFSKSKRPMEAERFYKQMETDGVQNNESVLAAMVDCICKSDVDPTTANITSVVNRALGLIHDAHRKCCPVNAWSYTSILSCLAKCGTKECGQRALQILYEMDRTGVQV